MQNVCVFLVRVGVYLCFEFLSYSMHARTTDKPKPHTHHTNTRKKRWRSATHGLMVGFRASACPQVVQMLRSLCPAGSVGRWDHCNTESCAPLVRLVTNTQHKMFIWIWYRTPRNSTSETVSFFCTGGVREPQTNGVSVCVYTRS